MDKGKKRDMPFLDGYLLGAKRQRRNKPRYDGMSMANYGCDPCASMSCDPCCSMQCNPCNSGPSGSTGLDQEPTVKDCLWQVCIDVTCYNPEDIIVYAENNKLIVLAEKEPMPGQFPLLTTFERKFDIPEGYDMENVGVYFSSDCILVIAIPCVRTRIYDIQPIGPARCFVTCGSDGKDKDKDKDKNKDSDKDKDKDKDKGKESQK